MNIVPLRSRFLLETDLLCLPRQITVALQRPSYLHRAIEIKAYIQLVPDLSIACIMLYYFFDTLQMRAVRRARRRGVSTLQHSGRLESGSPACKFGHSLHLQDNRDGRVCQHEVLIQHFHTVTLTKY